MKQRDYYEGDDQDDDGYNANAEHSDESYPQSSGYPDDDNDLDSDAINDFTSQELDKRIQQMKEKIKDLQDDDLEFHPSSEKKKQSGRKDYKIKAEVKDVAPKQYSK